MKTRRKKIGVTANRSKTPLLYKSQTQQFHLPAIFTRMASRQRDLDRRDRDTVGKNNGREYAKVFFEKYQVRHHRNSTKYPQELMD